MSKSGQVTAFIILGIVIMTVVSVAFYFRNQLISLEFSSSREESIIIPIQLRPVKNHIDNCLRETSIEGLYQIGRQGGYYNVPVESSITFFTESVPYYYLDNQEITPSIKIIEKELASYISDNLIVCLNFQDFIDNGFKIRQGNYKISTAINDKNVDIRMYYPIGIEKSGISIVLKDFRSTIDSNMRTLKRISMDIVDSYSERPGLVCLTCLEDLSKNDDVAIQTIPVDVSVFERNIIWFLITDKEYNLNGKNLTLRFVVEK